MLVIPNTTTVATEQTTGFTAFPPDVGALTYYSSGYLFVANASAQIAIKKGPSAGEAAWTPYALISPSLVPITSDRGGKQRPDYVWGVKFVDGVPGVHSQVFGALFQPGEPQFTPGSQFLGNVASGGGFTPPVGPVQVQHNGVLIGTEQAIDFEDSAATGGVAFTVTDDPPNSRVKVFGTTPSYSSTFTPALTATVSNPNLGASGSAFSRWTLIGKTVHYFGQINFGGAGVSAGSGTYQISIPTFWAASIANAAAGNAYLFHNATGFTATPVAKFDGVNTGYFNLIYPNTWPSGTLIPVSDSAPWVWAAGDQLQWDVVYQAA